MGARDRREVEVGDSTSWCMSILCMDAMFDVVFRICVCRSIRLCVATFEPGLSVGREQGNTEMEYVSHSDALHFRADIVSMVGKIVASIAYLLCFH